MRIGKIQRRSDKARRIDLARGPYDDAVGIDEIKLAVGLQRPVNRRDIAARHAVERGRGAGRHLKAGQLSRGDGKILPIDNRRARGLVDRDRARQRINTGRTRNNLTAGRVRPRGERLQRQKTT